MIWLMIMLIIVDEGDNHNFEDGVDDGYYC